MSSHPPLTDARLFAVLGQQNRWARARLEPGMTREIVDRLEPFLETPEIVALVGPRRAGKTTVLFQVMRALEKRRVPWKSCLHVNFEEPALAPELGVELLERIYRVYRTEVQPTGRAYLFLDEIQQVPGWERWVRARNEREDIKIFLTGSSAALMSRELGTLLTGRHVTFQVLPLSFREYLRFRGVPEPAEPRLVDSPPEIRNALLAYLEWGGFPEVALAEDDDRKRKLLKQYFDDVLFRDVAMRHEIRDVPTLRSLAVHLLGQTASLTSLKRVAGILDVSVDMAKNYCAHLEEAFLISWLPFWSLKTAERIRRPRKVHAVDSGLRNAVAITGSPDRGRLAETVALQALARDETDGLYYWRGKGEIDLVARRANSVERLVQVAWTGLDDPKIRRREIGALVEAKRAFPDAEALCVVGEVPETPIDEVRLLPLWRFLLGER